MTRFPPFTSSCPTRSRSRRFIRTFAVFLLFLGLTAGCGKMEKNPEPGEAVSSVSAEDCLLCGDGAALPREQDNIGLISFNTLAVTPIEINRYDGSGALIAENTGVMTLRPEEQGSGFSAQLWIDADRGMATADCTFDEDETLDAEQAAEVLCQSCLDTALSGGTAVGVVDFATRTVRPLAEDLTGFGIGNYYVHCDWDQSGTGAKLWVFYLPPRYP